jgi:hypothetical protein
MKWTHDVTRERVLDLIGNPDRVTEDSESAKDDLIRDLFGALIEAQSTAIRLQEKLDQRPAWWKEASVFITAVILVLAVVATVRLGFDK